MRTFLSELYAWLGCRCRGHLYLDEPEFRVYFKALDRLGVPSVVHHTPLPVDYQSLTEYPNLVKGLNQNVDRVFVPRSK